MAQVVGVTNFITASEASYQAKKTASLLKTLSVSALIMGELGVGKETLASYILPEASKVDASDFDELLVSLESCSEIIILNIDTSPNIQRLVESIQTNNVRVIATSKQSFSNEFSDELFNIKLDIPPLSERREDVKLLVESFVKEAAALFGGENKFELEGFEPDISLNSNSLRRQVMINYLLKDIKDSELMEIMQNYLSTRLGSNSDYRNFLYLYEAPLINAGLRKYKSQLQLSDKLGLNRNTLRKKIADNKKYLTGEK